MLEQMRRQGASIFVYLIFGLLIVIFVLNFAPSRNRGGLEGGCGTSSNVAVAVDRGGANNTAYTIAYSFPYSGDLSSRQKVYIALDQLIRRELLAQAAGDRGIHATDKLFEADIMQKRGAFYLGGQRLDFTHEFYDQIDNDLVFNLNKYKAWVTQRDVSQGAYEDDQARGLQASMMSDIISGSVRVSRDEALADYLYDNDTVSYDVVAFDPVKYKAALQLTDADTQRFLDSHLADVQASYKSDERTYKARKPELQIREIFIPKAMPAAIPPPDDKDSKDKADDKAAKPADDEAAKADKTTKPAKPDDKAKPADKAKPTDKTDKAKPTDKADKKLADKPDDKKPAAGAAPKAFGLPIEVAKAKLEAARTAIVAGKLTFAEAEKQLAPDASEVVPTSNGDRGWQPIDKAALGEQVVDDAIKQLKPGDMTQVIVTERGAYLLTAASKREGDLSFDQVKLELAAKLAKDTWGKEAAKRDALEALAKAAAGKNLDQLFEKAPPAPQMDPQLLELLKNPNIPTETKKQLFQQYQMQQQLQQLQQKHGSLETHEEDVPVTWLAEADGSGTPATPATTPAAPATAPAAPATAPAASSVPAAGSAGSAKPAPAAAGSASAPAAAITASTDLLPKLAEVARPKMNHYGPSPRLLQMEGLGGSKEASNALFEELSPGKAAGRLYDSDAGYLLVELVDHGQPKVEDFDKTADTEIARLRAARGKVAVHDWLKDRCEALTKANKIHPSPDRVREVDDKGNPAPAVYRPCMELDAIDR